ncbi:hypothetical protein [Alcanivorax sp.]|uniref:hypothetical protein n=1 Tax=Alcanivorax sp. TaxID=1872427 RepID=UPI003BAC3336
MNRYWNIILAGFALFSLLAIYCMAGEMDYQDAKLEEQHTCAMVRDGIWPAEQAENYNCAGTVRVAGVE